MIDDAEVIVLQPEADKIFDSSNYGHTASNEVTIGESAIYDLTITFPEGVIDNAVITDNFPSGLAFAECQSVSVSSGDLTTDLPGGFAAACNDDTNPTVQNNGDLVQFSLGNVTNANTNNSVEESVTYTIRTVALNICR